MGQNTGSAGVKTEAMTDAALQASVIKLAQAGNLRAIAFWLNRHLVPKGICAQVLAEQPGHLLVRLVCHRTPDRDLLIRFICHRLGALNSDLIRTVRVTAQLVGVSDLLWQSAGRISITGQPAPGQSTPGQLIPGQSTPGQPTANPIAHQPINPPVPPSSRRSGSPRVPTSPAVNPLQSAVPTASGQAKSPAAASTPIKRPPTSSASAKSKFKPKQVKQVNTIVAPADWSQTVSDQAVALAETVQDLTAQSIKWFRGQKLPIQALTLGGSAVAVFLIGCGFELLRQYAIDPTLGQTATSSPFTLPLGSRPNSVTTALESIPVIKTNVVNPEDPSVTLLFSNSSALGRVPKQQTNGASLSGANYETGGIAAYRQADLIMTSLNDPLTLQQVLPQSSLASPTSTAQGTETLPSMPLPEQEVNLIGATEPEIDTEATAIETATEEDDASRPGMAKATVQELLVNGVDIVNIADSQAEQPKTAELVQTLDVLKRSNIFSLGAGQDTQEARRPQVFDVKGQRIAYLGYSDPSLSTTLAVATGMAPSLKSQMIEDIQAIREQVDWVVVSFRWQRELRAYPESWQVELAHLAVDQGADLVVGYHPHLTQGAEIYQGRAIVYSIGSSIEEFIDEYAYEDYYAEDNTDVDKPEKDTVTLKVTLQDHTMNLEFLPVKIRDGQATIAEGEAGQSILDYVQQASSFFAQPMQFPTVLDARVRLSLPSAPDAELPTEPFLAEPDSL